MAICGLIGAWATDVAENSKEMTLERTTAIEKRLDRLEERLIFLEQQQMATIVPGDSMSNEDIVQLTPHVSAGLSPTPE